jgi:hypothetical protein
MKSFSLEAEYGEVQSSNGRVRPLAPRQLLSDANRGSFATNRGGTAAPHQRSLPSTIQTPPLQGGSAPGQQPELIQASFVDPKRCAILDRLTKTIPFSEDIRPVVLRLAREALVFHCPSMLSNELVEGVADVAETIFGPTGMPRYTERTELDRQVNIAAIDWLTRAQLILPQRLWRDSLADSPAQTKAPEDVLSGDYEERITDMWCRRDASVLVAVPQFRNDGSVLVIGIVKCSAKGVFRWQLAIGNRISSEPVQLTNLQHLQLVRTEIVMRDDHEVEVDGTVTTTTSLELLPGSLRQGTQYTVWLVALDAGAQRSDLQTFFVP